ncbi:DUF2809 domain-containing protein [Agrobacterium sp.]|uniref:ribosomal maturation YjgA family protein n=1 Tax=Agrobacterium sp. TaxID=361 RepID=UPI0028A93269|nr:DUF2809 domain-containing protein [Agrobacterium sp.]
MALSPFSRFYSARLGHFSGACLVIVLGLSLRKFGYSIGLPFGVVKYGGSILWGSMVYLLIATLLVRHSLQWRLMVAIASAVVVELIRLVHFPPLDAFRDTALGTLLLGRVFSPWNIVCYITGITAAAFIAERLLRWSRRSCAS